MSKSNDKHNVLHVVQHADGWAVKKTHAERASGVFDRQAEAIDRVKELAGRGEVIVHGQERSALSQKAGRFENSRTPYGRVIFSGFIS
jgi:hypothetical protein